MRKRAIVCGAAVVGCLGAGSRAAPILYSDTHGDAVAATLPANPARDIWSATVDNDGSNLIFTVNLDPAATLGTVTFNYGIGITTGPGAGGDLGTDATWHGNAYKRTISIASSQGGMIDWIGLFPAGGAGTVASPWTSYGFNVYNWNGAGSTWGTAVHTVASGQPMATQNAQTGLSSITVTVPITDLPNLNLQTGSSFSFDIYSTGSSGQQTAYDSLANASPTQTGTYNGSAQYDGTALVSYTVVPEPGALAVLSLGGLALVKRRAKVR